MKIYAHTELNVNVRATLFMRVKKKNMKQIKKKNPGSHQWVRIQINRFCIQWYISHQYKVMNV
jgi:hypothetical protein